MAAYLRRTDESWLGQLRAASEWAGELPGEQSDGARRKTTGATFDDAWREAAAAD